MSREFLLTLRAQAGQSSLASGLLHRALFLPRSLFADRLEDRRISFLFAVVQLSAEPEFTGIVSGLMIAGRVRPSRRTPATKLTLFSQNFGGSVGPAVCVHLFLLLCIP